MSIPRPRIYVRDLGSVQKSLSSKAAAIWTLGGCAQYVSIVKRQECHWQLFSTIPREIPKTNGTQMLDLEEECGYQGSEEKKEKVTSQ